SAFGTVEYHHDPFTSWMGFDLGLTAGLYRDGQSNGFIGAGLVATRDLGKGGWFVQLSEMPGYYHSSDDAHDLGLALEFQSQLAVGYRLTDGNALSLGVAHMSNAKLGDRNPGVNLLQMRLHHRLGR
ncbi:acyloxyacyl hydrolase, partial [Paracoccus sp. (in: a-proteobacteria)]|uniref:acyloxyacyl hydrolase n=1 Tax=Paracoccus sp. TaxID=267 RepID=UPI003A8C04E8